MKAIFCTQYGPPDVLQVREVEKPTPKPNEVLIRIRATTVSAADCELRRFDFPGWVWLPVRLWFGLLKPRVRVFGQELAGEIEETGEDARSFKKGDRVFAATGMGLGAHAEYICLPETPMGGAMARMPSNMSFEEAAAVPYGGGEALQFLRKANIQSEQKVLINGAGGSFGTFAVQLAKCFGAQVTAVDSTLKLDMLRSLGADHVIDYTREDFTDSHETYDVIFDVVRNSSSRRMVRSLRENGTYLTANPGFAELMLSLRTSMTGKKKVILGVQSGTNKDLEYLRDLIEAGKLRPVVDRQFPLEQTAEAHRYAESGQKKGNVVITIAPHGHDPCAGDNP
jgi:NADPH:quinone reductase-like Zn-dependent oxidoreductase